VNEVKTLAFTGLHPHKLPWGANEDDPRCLSLKIALRERLIRLIEGENVRRFISGMAMGIDMICAELVLELKASYPDITLTAAISNKEQDLLWPQKQRERYARILGQCDSVHAVSEVYTDDCMELRNRWMADECDILLAVWNDKPGGAGSTISYAMEQGKRVIIVDPAG